MICDYSSNMNSKDLGLPIFYQQYPEYFDDSSNACNANEKNKVIEGLLKKYHAKTVLDMTCGTGSQVLYLAERGYDVIGSDFSPKLLAKARDKAKKQHLDIELIEGDMRALQVGQFDSVITIDNAIGHLVKKDFELATRNICENLKSGGVYIFDILNLDAMTNEVIKADNEKMTDEKVMNDGTVIHNTRHTTVDRENGYFISEDKFIIQMQNETREFENKCILQIYTMKELQSILLRNGFKIIEQYKADAYTFKKDDTGFSIITVAKKL